jgi:hypothetical protein
MLRWVTPILVAICAAGTAAAQGSPDTPGAANAPAAAKPDAPPATQPVSKDPGKAPAARRPVVKAARQLPPGLPRAHYSYRTTVASPAPQRYVRRGRTLVIEEPEVDVLTSMTIVPFAPGVNGTPLLPGSSTLPGYYGTDHSYSYDGPYYGGPYEPFWNRLPYACGVYGYC